MGYYLGLAKVAQLKGNTGKEKAYTILSILVPTIMHAIYDFCLFSENDMFMYIFYAFVTFVFIYCIVKIRLLSQHDIAINTSNSIFRNIINNINKPKFCTNCGAPLNGPFCQNCGYKNY